MPTRNVNITPHFDQFIEGHISAGRYSNASELVRAALRLLEERELEREQKLENLRKAAKVGFDEIDQGKGIRLQGEQELEQFLKRIGEEVSKKRKRAGK